MSVWQILVVIAAVVFAVLGLCFAWGHYFSFRPTLDGPSTAEIQIRVGREACALSLAPITSRAYQGLTPEQAETLLRIHGGCRHTCSWLRAANDYLSRA
ncbi:MULTISPECIES: hypothetical protein [Nocardia]|uniref:hypothetical protein n=1 Tax=Nocardia TaxID=1817 RepID=UPI002456BE92|nr:MULTISPECIES: hypothetical protein [Nocardia]